MRARYYEPGSGRFVEPDDARDGANYFVYCSNQPVNRIDSSGNDDWNPEDKWQFGNWMAIGTLTFMAGAVLAMPFLLPVSDKQLMVAAIFIAAAAGAFATAYGVTAHATGAEKFGVGFAPWVIGIALSIAAAMKPAATNALTRVAIIAYGLYDTVMLGVLIDIGNGE